MSLTASYPAHLPPQVDYGCLSVKQLVSQGRCLLRAVDRLTYDPDGLISANLVYPSGSTQGLDYSVNLVGTFQCPADGIWRVTPQVPWQPGQLVQAPTNPAKWDPYDWFVLPIEQLHQQPTSLQIAGQAVQCYVCHDPTQANYWHFVVRFADARGVNVKALAPSPSALKRLSADLRSWFRVLIGRYPRPQQLPDGPGIIPVPLACCQHPHPDECPSVV